MNTSKSTLKSYIADVKKEYNIRIENMLSQVKGKDSLILIRHNGATMAGAFDTDNYKHNTLAQTSLANLQIGDQV